MMLNNTLDKILKGAGGRGDKAAASETAPDRGERAAAWQTAIGLQGADGLSTSEFLWQISQKQVNGQMSFDEVGAQVDSYYFERNAHDSGDPENENADKVAVNIARILLTETLDFSVEGLTELNRRIFDGVYENAGAQRQVDVSKREWVLGGDTVSFLSLEALPGALEQSIAREKEYGYESYASEAFISHLSSFISEVWRICPFGEGNTRFVGVLTVLYLRQMGVSIKFDSFKNDSWYFHNALVRANYRDIVKHIEYDTVYLERFFRNMLLGEKWDLRNRYLHVRPAAEWSVQTNLNSEAETGQVQLKQDTRKIEVKYENGTSKIEEKVKKETRKDKDRDKITSERTGKDTDDGTPQIIQKRTRKNPANTVATDMTHVTDTKTKPATPKRSVSAAEKGLENPYLLFLAAVIGEKFLSVKEIMAGLHLKGRDSFLKLYLTPAINSGIVTLLYPSAPKHPRQKYLLTQKGLDYLAQTGPEMVARVRRHLGGDNI